MTEQQFWVIIENCFDHQIASDDELARLEVVLRRLPRSEVVSFQENLRKVMARAYSWELIAGACFLGCGQSDDGFEDFRAWLVSRGRDTFERILSDVNVLASFPYKESPTEEWYLEMLHMLPGEVGGEEDDPDWPYSFDPEKPHGESLEITQEILRDRYPKLWERFGNNFMIGIT